MRVLPSIVGAALATLILSCAPRPESEAACATLPGDWSWQRTSDVSARYFTSPELGSPSYLAYWDDNQIHKACADSRRQEHEAIAPAFAQLLADFDEPDLRADERRVLRVAMIADGTTQRDLYRLTFDTEGANLRVMRWAWVPPAQAIADMSPEEASEAFSPSRYRRVVSDFMLSRRDASELWELQRSIKPIPEGYFGYAHSLGMVVETTDHGLRNARWVLGGITPGTTRLQCKLVALSLPPDGSIARCGD